MSSTRLVALAVVGLIAACKGRTSSSAGRPSPATALEQACDRGDLRACGQAASLYLDGQGSPRTPSAAGSSTSGPAPARTRRPAPPWRPDPARGATLFEAGCGGGVGAACMELALMHHDGNGVARDEDGAKTLLKKACDLKEAAACEALTRL